MKWRIRSVNAVQKPYFARPEINPLAIYNILFNSGYAVKPRSKTRFWTWTNSLKLALNVKIGSKTIFHETQKPLHAFAMYQTIYSDNILFNSSQNFLFWGLAGSRYENPAWYAVKLAQKLYSIHESPHTWTRYPSIRCPLEKSSTISAVEIRSQ